VRIVLKTLFQFLVITLGSMLLPVVCLGESFTIEQVLSAPFPYGLTGAVDACGNRECRLSCNQF